MSAISARKIPCDDFLKEMGTELLEDKHKLDLDSIAAILKVFAQNGCRIDRLMNPLFKKAEEFINKYTVSTRSCPVLDRVSLTTIVRLLQGLEACGKNNVSESCEKILQFIAKQTENYTGSDLRELIRVTKLEKLKSDWLDSDGNFSSSSSSLPLPPSSSSSSTNDGISDLDKGMDKHDRPLSMENFNIAISKSILSSEAALDYSKEIVLETLKERC
jgi:hypothetical protein